MNISLLQCLKEQEEYDRILKKKSQGNLCPSDYLKQKYDHKHSISALINAHSDLDNLRLLTLNIAEFTEKRLGLQQLENIITSQDVKGDVDIICLTEILAETWNQFITELISKKKKPEKQSTIELNGVVYDCFINFSKPVSKRSKGKNKIKYLKNNNTAGCAVLVSKKFKERPHTVMFDMNPSLEQQEQFALNEETYLCLDQEGRLITLLFDKFCLITLYAPNNSEKYQDEFDIWQQCIINYIQNLQQALDEDYAIILTGDFNIKNDHLTYKNLEETCQLKEVKGITHSFYKKNSQDQLQIDYTFISANNKLFENMKTQLVEQFELVTEQNKYHIPFLSIFQNQKQNNSKSPKSDKKSQSSGEDSEDDIQDLIQITNKIKLLNSQINSQESKSQEQKEDLDEFNFLNQKFDELNLGYENKSQHQYNEIQTKEIQEKKSCNLNVSNQNQQKSQGIHKQFKMPSSLKNQKSNESSN